MESKDFNEIVETLKEHNNSVRKREQDKKDISQQQKIYSELGITEIKGGGEE